MSGPSDPRDRDVPADVEAERAVLGSLLVDPFAVAQVADTLRPQDFYRGAHAAVFRVMLALGEKHEPTDLVLVSGALERAGRLDDVGGLAYLTGLLNATPSAVHAEHYARRVSEAAVARRLIRASGEVAKAAYEGWESGDIAGAADKAEAAILAADGRTDGAAFAPMEALMSSYLDRLDAVAKGTVPAGVPTGFGRLDNATGGLHRGELIVLAARPGLGKTSFALSIAANVAAMGAAVGVFSLEMTKEQLGHRLVSSRAKVDGHRLRLALMDDDEWQRVVDASGDLAGLPLLINDRPSLTVLELRAAARRLNATRRLGLLVVDYVQLMAGTGKRENRVQEVAEISRGLRALAKELDVPVLACAQLNREVEKRGSPRPQLSDLRESGQLEQDADVVLFLWREETNVTPTEVVDLTIAKQRNGPTLDVQLFFRRQWTRFEEPEYHHREAPAPSGTGAWPA